MHNILRPVLRSTRTGVRTYKQMTPELRPPHMDELPVPAGSWKAAYDKDQSKYNRQLLIGILSLVATIGFGVQTNLLWFNFLPPKQTSEKPMLPEDS